MIRRTFQIFSIVVMALCVHVLPLAADNTEPAPPSVVEAGFITKFPLFITWPDEPWRNPNTNFVVGVVGDTPVYKALQQLARYTTVDGSTLDIRQINELQQANDCQVLFIAETETDRLDEILDHVRELPILTVAASDGFAKRGVHINFYLENKFVRFEINQKACERAHLAMSFRLRDVAKIVESE